MNRRQSCYEQLKYPIKILFFSSLLIAVSSIFLHPSLSFINIEEREGLHLLIQILLYSGGTILSYFPLYIFVKLLSHRKDNQNIILAGLISYIVFTVVLTILSSGFELPEAAYISIGDILLKGEKTGLVSLGTFSFIAIYILVSQIYERTKEVRFYNFTSYLDKDTIRLLYVILGSVLLAFIFSYVWPIFINWFYSFLTFVSGDVNNPMTLFAYGGFERLSALFNLDHIVHKEIWFGSLGGSWVDLKGQTFMGDVSIWNAQLSSSVNVLGTSDAGRFISTYYVLNIFAIPAYLIAVYSLYTNKSVLNKNIFVLILAVLVSMISGTLLPVELMMLVTSPLIYIFHIFMTSFIFAILSGLSIYIGFSYSGMLAASNPGNLIDLIYLFNKKVLVDQLLILVLVGFLVALAYFAFTRIYYSHLALDVLNIGNKQEKIDDFVDRLGGLENIETITNSPTRIHVTLFERDKLNVQGMHRQGVMRVIETKNGFVLSIGSSAYIYQKEVNKRMISMAKDDEISEE